MTKRMGEERVMFRDDLNFLRHMPSRWTDLTELDPFVSMSDGRSAFRVADLLALADLLSALDAGVPATDL